MAAVNLTIDIPVFNFDIAQGQDLTIPISYEITGVPDTMVGATFKIELRTLDYTKIIDTLTSENNRISVTGVNTFNIIFPSAVTSGYKLTAATTKFIYSLKITRAGNTKRLFEGTVTVKREPTK